MNRSNYVQFTQYMCIPPFVELETAFLLKVLLLYETLMVYVLLNLVPIVLFRLLVIDICLFICDCIEFIY